MSGAPYNPFARTLATSEASFGLHRTGDSHQESEGVNGDGPPRPGAGKAPLDVDAFKNILLTGSAAPSPPAPATLQRLQDSSSSTNTSSISAHSLFDPVLLLHPASPLSRTSFDHDDSPSEDNDDEEGSSLMSGTSRLDDYAPPAPPKPTHSRTLGPKGPQTVSFANFDESIPSGFTSSRAPTPPVNTRPGGIMRPPTLRRTPSDLNKPLPPPPQSPTRLKEVRPDGLEEEPSIPQPQIPTITTTDESVPQKKAPPPPPSSRRTGQAGGSSGRARSGSDTTQDSTLDNEASIPPKAAETTPKAAALPPPPPPSRKVKPASQSSTPAIVTPPEVPSPAPATADTKEAPLPAPTPQSVKGR